MNLLTVFTPTFNRAHTLPDCYKSLMEQTKKRFVWLIIDDGSTDDTELLVNKWINEGILDIRYHWKRNGGMHTAHNMAFELCDTELICCLDSDDDLVLDAVEQIEDIWKDNEIEGIYGIIAHEAYRNTHKIIGTEFPNGLTKTKFYDLYYHHRVKGDKFLIFRTAKIRLNPYPEFEGERFVPLGYKYLMIDENLILLNRTLYFKEYLKDGYTNNLIKIYARNPKGFAFYHAYILGSHHQFYKKVKSAIHYTGTSILCRKKNFIINSPAKILTIATLPLGIIWYIRLYLIQKSLLPINKSNI